MNFCLFSHSRRSRHFWEALVLFAISSALLYFVVVHRTNIIPEENEFFRELDQVREDSLNVVASASVLEVFPFNKLILCKIHERVADCRDRQERIFAPKLQEHKQT